MKSTGYLVTVAMVLGLAGCGSGANSVSNPGFFSFRMEDGVMIGRYNPEGFTATEVRKLLKAQCDPAVLGSYAKRSPDADGLIGFNARCRKSGRFARGSFQVEKVEGGKVVIEATGS
ncbi:MULTISPECIES: hypothetical protein [unclassified Roseovarius]|uniref:hypothetical protein n=1 Tax=unclassified Roseovarius TaxID=2614913 RepID=UPI00273FAD5E|nr:MULTISPECIES: hypothetical protein [unclassified Roseovarius]